MEKKYVGVVTENGEAIEFIDMPQEELDLLQQAIDTGNIKAENGKIVIDLESEVNIALENFLENHHN
ncbi:MAG: hypothetical protein H7836_14595 [Magnetococcus sp. YQC-3]